MTASRLIRLAVVTVLVGACSDGKDTDTDAPTDNPVDTDVPAPAPTISEVTPAQGGLAGGTLVTLTGAGFLNNDAGLGEVAFGGEAGVGCGIFGDTSVRCTTPPRDPGVVDVVLSNANGTVTATGAFTYDAPRVLFAADGKTGVAGDLYEIDPATASAEIIGTVGYAITGLCMAPDGTLFGTEATQSGNMGTARLIQIDIATGAGTPIGDLPTGLDSLVGSVPVVLG